MDRFEYKCKEGHKKEKTFLPGTRIEGRDEIVCPECLPTAQAIAYLVFVRRGETQDGKRP
jgi:hypothetical protein